MVGQDHGNRRQSLTGIIDFFARRAFDDDDDYFCPSYKTH